MQTKKQPSTDPDAPEYDAVNDCYRIHHDEDGTASITTTVVHALTRIVDADVSQGEFSLYDSVDPDALERLFASKADGSKRSDGHVAFRALKFDVYVYANGDIVLYPPSSDGDCRRPPH